MWEILRVRDSYLPQTALTLKALTVKTHISSVFIGLLPVFGWVLGWERFSIPKSTINKKILSTSMGSKRYEFLPHCPYFPVLYFHFFFFLVIFFLCHYSFLYISGNERVAVEEKQVIIAKILNGLSSNFFEDQWFQNICMRFIQIQNAKFFKV